MRDYSVVLKDLKDFFIEITSFEYASGIEEYRKRYIALRDEVKTHYPLIKTFNKLMYTTSSFDYTYPQMREECIEMITETIKQMNNPPQVEE